MWLLLMYRLFGCNEGFYVGDVRTNGNVKQNTVYDRLQFSQKTMQFGHCMRFAIVSILFSSTLKMT